LKIRHLLARAFPLTALLVFGADRSSAQIEVAPTSSTPGQAIPGTLGVSPFSGSVPTKLVPGILPLSLQGAIDRGLKQNLGLLLSSADIGSARGQRWQQLSALLPHVSADPTLQNQRSIWQSLALPVLGEPIFPRPSDPSLISMPESRSVSRYLIGSRSTPRERPAKI
jgi:hypothetical protein